MYLRNLNQTITMLHTSIPSAPGRTTKCLLVAIVAAGCGGDSKPTVDAMPDAPPVALTCMAYCSEIQTHCTGPNAQYADADHCMAACASFTPRTSTTSDMPENTLGCRIFQGGAPSMTAPAAHCPQAGPAGDLLTANPAQACSGGNVCASFCALEIGACGSLDHPLDGDPRDATNNHLYQFRNMKDRKSVV